MSASLNPNMADRSLPRWCAHLIFYHLHRDETGGCRGPETHRRALLVGAVERGNRPSDHDELFRCVS